jgi:hypothetical protein
MPGDVNSTVGWFDSFATRAAKFNAIAAALSKVVEAQGEHADAAELRAAVGLEDRESSDGK